MVNTAAAFDGQSLKQVGADLTLQQENKLLRARIAELESLVVRDTLTPLYNRRHFTNILDRWIWRAHRYEGQYGLMFIDIDGLKMINDTHGHAAGDAMLVGVAKALQSAVRKSDIAARISGDEFALLLENIPEAGLPAKAARITKAIAKLSVKHDNIILKPSVSVGFTPVVGGISATALLARADASMYANKHMKQ